MDKIEIYNKIFEDNSFSKENLWYNNANKNKLLLFADKMVKRRRDKQYWKKINNGFKGIRIVAEGDSWFNYPVFLKDIVDYLMEESNFAVYSLSKPGDWFSNMLQEGDYLNALKVHDPDVFLLSGGGNDMLQDFRLATLIKNQNEYIATGRIAHFNDNFKELMNLFEKYYVNIFKELLSEKPTLQIILHGYAYAYPNHIEIRTPIDWLESKLVKNGIWLEYPLNLKGYHGSSGIKQAIIKELIDSFYCMLYKASKNFRNVHIVDCRKVLGQNKRVYWHNELHLSNIGSKLVANEFIKKIKQNC